MKEFYKRYLNDTKEYSEEIKTVTKILDKYVLPSLNKDMNIIQLLQTIINNFKSSLCDDSKKVLRKKIISHSNRVYKNATIIVSYIELRYNVYLTPEEYFILTIGCLLHDIGKVYSDDNHNLFSTVIVEYLLKLDKRFDAEMIDQILEMIYFHTKKNKYKDRISLLAKILRDADLFDEECGDSLYGLLLTKVINDKKNLNKLKIKEAKELLSMKLSFNHKKEIKLKINLRGCDKLYENLLSETVEKFYLFVDELEEYDCEEDYYHDKLNYYDYLRINIKIDEE